MSDPDFGDVRGLDLASLLSAVGALQLIPENAAHCLRLEHLAHVSCQASGKDSLTHGLLLALWPSIAASLEPLAGLEDPQESNYVEEIGFRDRVYRALPGIVQDNTFILQHMLDALHDIDPSPDDCALVETVLGLSDEIAVRAGLDRRALSESEPGSPITLPPADSFERLRQAVIFDEDDLRRIAPARVPPLDCLAALICSPEDVAREEIDPDSGPLLRTPLVRVGGRFVCPAPASLLAALRHALIVRFSSRGTANRLAIAFHDRVFRTVVSAFRRCGMDIFRRAPLGPTREGVLSDAILAFDTDKVALVTLTTDPLDDYDGSAPFGEWRQPDWSVQLERRIEVRRRQILAMARPPNGIHELHVIQGVGRSAVHAGPSTEHLAEVARLLMTAAELRLIASVDDDNPLVFWQYAQALERRRRSTLVIATSMIDGYGLYRRYDRSFYVSEDASPDAISIVPGWGANLRRELADKHDEHLRFDPQTGRCVPVARVYAGSSLPLYRLSWPEGQFPAITVDGYVAPCWIIGINEFVGKDGRLEGLCEQLVDGLAYWLHELAPRLRLHLTPLARGPGKLEIGVQLEQTEMWLRDDDEPTPDDPGAFVASKATPEDGVVMLAFRPPISALSATADNAGERLLLKHTLGALSLSLGPAGITLSAQDIDDLVDWAAPLGPKRKLTHVDLYDVPDLDRRGLRPARNVQPSQVNAALDDLGAHLRQERQLPIGAIAPSEAHSVLKESVDFLYRRFERLVSTLAPDGLMEWLVGMHESLAGRTARHRLTLHNRLAAFAADKQVLINIQEELREISTPTFSSWFLIEYVSAKPPRGMRPISLSVHDDLIALGTLMVQYGWDCDMVFFDLAEIPLALLPSLRLGADRSRLTAAQINFLGPFAADYVERAREEARIRLGGGRRRERGTRSMEADTVVQAEYGCSLSDVLSVLGQCVGWGLEEGQAITVRPLERFLNEMSSSLGWERARVEHVIGQTTLRARNDFLRPEGRYLRRDVYPWRFERYFSYLWRPLVLRDVEEAPEVIWGHRHTVRAMAHWVQACSQGRAEMKSDEMRQWAGRRHHAAGEDFNDAVAVALEGIVSGRVLRRVDKIGKRKVVLDGRALGDIDVLASRLIPATIYVVECKALAGARTPDRLKSEIQELFDRSSGANSAVVKLERKVEWVRMNLDLCATRLALGPIDQIEIVPIVVVDRELLSPHIVGDRVLTVALNRLRDALQ